MDVTPTANDAQADKTSNGLSGLGSGTFSPLGDRDLSRFILLVLTCRRIAMVISILVLILQVLPAQLESLPFPSQQALRKQKPLP